MRQDDSTDEAFDRPIIVDQLQRKMVEEFRMARGMTRIEGFDGMNEAAAQKHRPNSVHFCSERKETCDIAFNKRIAALGE